MNKELFKEYADIKNQIKDLTTKSKEIEILVTKEMNKEEVEQVRSDFGTFYFISRKTWKYPKRILEMEINLKEEKKKVEEEGKATFEEKKSLAFRV